MYPTSIKSLNDPVHIPYSQLCRNADGSVAKDKTPPSWHFLHIVVSPCASWDLSQYTLIFVKSDQLFICSNNALILIKDTVVISIYPRFNKMSKELNSAPRLTHIWASAPLFIHRNASLLHVLHLAFTLRFFSATGTQRTRIFINPPIKKRRGRLLKRRTAPPQEIDSVVIRITKAEG